MNFKFLESRNTAVFSLKQIFREGKPILYVSHDDEDGAWQFLTGESISERDLMIVSLEQVLKHDSTINELFDLPGGMYATRKFIGDNWVRMIADRVD